MTTLVTTRAKPGHLVVVSGLGPVGNLAAQIFRHCGYNVAAVEPSKARRKTAREAGIDQVFDSMPLDNEQFRDRVKLVVECSGHEGATLDACRIVAKGGEVVLVGVPWRKQTDDLAHDVLHAVFHRYVHLRSGWEWELPRQPGEFSVASIRENIALATTWLNQKKIFVNNLYWLSTPSQCQDVYQTLLTKSRREPSCVYDWQNCG